MQAKAQNNHLNPCATPACLGTLRSFCKATQRHISWPYVATLRQLFKKQLALLLNLRAAAAHGSVHDVSCQGLAQLCSSFTALG